MMLQFTYYSEDGDELEGELPAVHEVCSRCEGHGSHLNPSIGEHAYSREEFEEAFDDDDSREQYFKRGGIYDVTCDECHGARVVKVIDAKACRSPAQKALLKEYDRKQRDAWEYERECAAERRLGY